MLSVPSELCNTRTTIKSPACDCGDIDGDSQVSQAATATEGSRSNLGYGRWQGDTSQSSATLKGIAADSCHTVGLAAIAHGGRNGHTPAIAVVTGVLVSHMNFIVVHFQIVYAPRSKIINVVQGLITHNIVEQIPPIPRLVGVYRSQRRVQCGKTVKILGKTVAVGHQRGIHSTAGYARELVAIIECIVVNLG